MNFRNWDLHSKDYKDKKKYLLDSKKIKNKRDNNLHSWGYEYWDIKGPIFVLKKKISMLDKPEILKYEME